jgi:membrane dipeptidase
MSADPHALTTDPKILAFHQKTYVFDGLSIAYMLDEKYTERLVAGGVDGTNVTFALEEDWDTVLRNAEKHLTKIEKNPHLTLCLTAADLRAAKANGKIGVIFGTQGASMLEEKLWRVETLLRMGMRILGLAYTTANAFGDGCGEKRDAGLSYLGEELIGMVNEMPVILDLSHCGDRTRAEATAMARAPCCTHSNAAALRANGRNTTDDTVKAMVAKGSMIGVCGLPHSLADADPTLDTLLDHVDHFVKLVGVEGVGIGMDYVEFYQDQATVVASPSVVTWRTRRPDIFGTLASFGRQNYPLGVERVAKLPNFTAGLFARGYKPADVAAIMGGNWLRVIEKFCG